MSASGPFSASQLLSGIKDRVDALLLQGETLYTGTSTGTLTTYTLHDDPSGLTAQLLETKPNFTKRAIEQLGYIQDVNSLIVLSDSVATLFPLPKLSPPSPLTQARYAQSFATHSSIQQADTEDEPNTPTTRRIPSLLSRLAVGCRRKIVVYTWKDGEAQDPIEVNLSHSPRSVGFIDTNTVVLAYETEHAILYLKTLSVAELKLATPSIGVAAISKVGMGALSGLGGYMTLGLGAKNPKPIVAHIKEGEALIAKESLGHLIGADGKPTRSTTLEYPSTLDDATFLHPYILSLLPTLSTTGSPSLPPRINVKSSLSLADIQTLPYPFSSTTSALTPPSITLRLLTPGRSMKSTSYACVLSTPTDSRVASAEGSSIWALKMQNWGEQIDDLVNNGKYSDALALLDAIESESIDNKDSRQSYILGLHALSLFSQGSYDEAIDLFLQLGINPAKVVALYPESISGRLYTPPDEWVTLFKGKRLAGEESAALPLPVSESEASLKRAIETLMMRYLPHLRPRISHAISQTSQPPASVALLQSDPSLSLSSVSPSDLLSLPDGSLNALTPNELIRFAQIVDTALFKTYLMARPSLVGSLCRVENWCEVPEVEQVLKEKQKFSELIDLYRGKKMHEQALSLLHDLSAEEEDLEEKLDPAIRYLQKLGPEYIDLIFDNARWIIAEDHKMGLTIFTSEDVILPRNRVADFLQSISLSLCASFFEYLIGEAGENEPAYHDRLADLYLKVAMDTTQSSDEQRKAHDKLLEFISTSTLYRPDRLFSRLPPTSLYDVRAILLGRLGEHKAALEIYVHQLHDYVQAEEYCKRVYAPPPDPKSSVFLILLKIYLGSPSTTTSSSVSPSSIALLAPALDLISRHSPRLDSVAVLDLLPPLVPASDVGAFLLEALRAPRVHMQVEREVWKGRRNEVDVQLIGLQERRVRVTDSRICPQCHKRLGNSVIAVHSPRGEVTHYQCREAFARTLKDLRRRA